jgi:hypothetical protein
MREEQLPQHVSPTYVLPDYKAVYIATSKAACTSLKWLVADVQGEHPERFIKPVSRMVSPDLCVHHRSGFKHTPTLHRFKGLADVAPDNGWFVFTVVRHPAARMFSAWQSKVLLREPRYVDKIGEEPFFPRVPRTSDELVEDFGRFVLAMAEGHPLMRNRHFMAQWEEVAPDRVPYSRIYDTSEIPRLLEDFGAHLRANGYPGELKLRESNETPLRPIRALYTDEVLEALGRLYAADYAQWGYEPLPRVSDAAEYTAAQLAEIHRLVERHERIGILADAAEAQERSLRELRIANGRVTAVKAPIATRAMRSVRVSPRAAANKARRLASTAMKARKRGKAPR